MHELGDRRDTVINLHFVQPPHEPTAAERGLSAELARVSAAQRIIRARLAEQMARPQEQRNAELVLALLDVQAALAQSPAVSGRS